MRAYIPIFCEHVFTWGEDVCIHSTVGALHADSTIMINDHMINNTILSRSHDWLSRDLLNLQGQYLQEVLIIWNK